MSRIDFSKAPSNATHFLRLGAPECTAWFSCVAGGPLRWDEEDEVWQPVAHMPPMTEAIPAIQAPDWSKAPPDATHYLPSAFGPSLSSFWRLIDGTPVRRWEADGQPLEGAVLDLEGLFDRLIERPAGDFSGQVRDCGKPVEVEPWGGGSLPPVGVECERHASGDLWERVCIKYQQANICVWEVIGIAAERCSDDAHKMVFRPIRTPEQIAADKRLHAVRNACTAIATALATLHESEEHGALTAIEAMLDSGYRKAPGYDELLAFAQWLNDFQVGTTVVSPDVIGPLEGALAAAEVLQ